MNKIIYNQYKKLFERLSDILYHFTYYTGLKHILRENKFLLSSGIGTESDDINRGKFFFLSATRSKSRWYGTRDVNIVLDGRKLNQKYKGFAVDYWNYSTNPNNYPDRKSYVQAMKMDELEDRIVSDSSTINNATDYIKEIHCLITYRWNEKKVDNVSKKDVDAIIELCKANRIDIYFYDDKKYYLSTVKQYSINPLELQYKEINDDNDYVETNRPKLYSGMRLAILLSYKDEKNYNKIITELDLSDKDIQRFKKEADEEYRDYFWYLENRPFDDYKTKEYFSTIKNNIHNNRSSGYKDVRLCLDMLSRDMRKRKVKMLKEYIQDKFKHE